MRVRREISGCSGTMNQLLWFTPDIALPFALQRMNGDRGGATQCQHRGISPENHGFDLGAVQSHIFERAVIERAQSAHCPPAFQPSVMRSPPVARPGGEKTGKPAGQTPHDRKAERSTGSAGSAPGRHASRRLPSVATLSVAYPLYCRQRTH